MLKMATRASAIGLAAFGLALALAPAAGASTVKPTPPAKPVTQTLSAATSFFDYSPCNGSPVNTTGHGFARTITDGQRTAVIVSDVQSGDGYQLFISGIGSFSSLSYSYTVHGEATWINQTKRSESFHALDTIVVSVTSTNDPTGFNSVQVSLKCGL